jgi:predicted metal-dependent hydrolase
MAQKTVWLPEVGELVLSKRRGTKNIRLSINAAGQIRVGLPAWAPYYMGINFARSRADWIKKHIPDHQSTPLHHDVSLGKSNRLHYDYDPGRSRTSARLLPGIVKVTSNLPLSDPTVQKVATQAAERALKKEAEKLLPIRLAELASKNGFSYKSIRIKKLKSRWGSCSSHKEITLNYFLMQLPWRLIDYVLLHELIHTIHLNHSQNFWRDFEKVCPDAKQIRKQIKAYRPIINSPKPIVA